MEKKPRKKKELKVKIDTKNVDIEYTRNADGEVALKVDTPIVDAHYTKDEDGNKNLEIVRDAEYEFESNGKSPHMPKGTVWKITGELLKNFLAKNLGKRIK
jgi:hypothetical protein